MFRICQCLCEVQDHLSPSREPCLLLLASLSYGSICFYVLYVSCTVPLVAVLKDLRASLLTLRRLGQDLGLKLEGFR